VLGGLGKKEIKKGLKGGEGNRLESVWNFLPFVRWVAPICKKKVKLKDENNVFRT